MIQLLTLHLQNLLKYAGKICGVSRWLWRRHTGAGHIKLELHERLVPTVQPPWRDLAPSLFFLIYNIVRSLKEAAICSGRANSSVCGGGFGGDETERTRVLSPTRQF